MSITYSYNLNLNTKEVVGTNPSAYKEINNQYILQANDNYIENSKSSQFTYTLGVNQTITIVLADLGIKFLKSICIDSINLIRYTYNTQTIDISKMFIDNKIPTTLPLLLDTNSIIIKNISSEIVDLTLFLIYI